MLPANLCSYTKLLMGCDGCRGPAGPVRSEAPNNHDTLGEPLIQRTVAAICRAAEGPKSSAAL